MALMQPSSTEPRTALLIFARAPLPGRCKTRLGACIGARPAARVQQQLLVHALTLARRWEGPTRLYCSPDTRHAAFIAARRAGFTLARQRGVSLGQRMYNAMTRAHAQGHHAILMGTDCPAMQAGSLTHVQQAMGSHDVVLIPTHDGGYVLIGCQRVRMTLFRGLQWGGSRVLAITRKKAMRAGMSTHIFPTQHDLDFYQDWLRARRAGWLPPLYRVQKMPRSIRPQH